jgi:alcohol dehydrogenase (NADP+)
MNMSDAAQPAAAPKDNPSQTQTFTARAYSAQSATSGLAPFTIRRRAPGAQDVQIEILYCGICHSDLHQVRNEWQSVMPTVYPCVPGHEIVGHVVKAGSDVKKFKEGNIAAVGCMVDSCRRCPNCLAGEEQYCDNALTLTYNGQDKFLGGVTYGGYSESVVVDQAYVVRVPNTSNLAGVAPLVCAGITTYSPMRHWNVRKG